jgi:phosphoglycerate dehydrogenase-like enzyme
MSSRTGRVSGSVVVLGKERLLFGDVARALQHQGVSVRSFADLGALVADSAALGRADVLYVPGGIGAAVLDAAPRLRGVVTPYNGIDSFDRGAASARGILIGNGQFTETTESMADATVMLLLAAAYDLRTSMQGLAEGWPQQPIAGRGRLLRAMTVGIVGYGRIAQAVVGRLRGFGCELLVHARRPLAELPAGVLQVPLTELATRADAILLLASLNAESRHLVNAELLARMKPEVILVNTSRGSLVDEQALVAAVRERRIGRLALDVFEQEPLPADSPLRGLPAAILTPHCAGHTRETKSRMPQFAVSNVVALLAGEPPLSVANPEALPAWRSRMERLRA